MKNLKYALEDIYRHPFKVGIIAIQIIVCLNLIISSISTLRENQAWRNKLSEVYGQCDPVRLVGRKTGEPADNNICSQIMSEINGLGKGNFEIVTVEPQEIYTDYNKGINFVSVDSTEYFRNKYPELTPMKTLTVGENFYKFFKLPMEEGEYFKEEDFRDLKSVPVVLGYNYKELCKIGDKFTAVDTERDRKVTCVVNGFLKKDTITIASLQSKTETLNVDNYIIYPKMELTVPYEIRDDKGNIVQDYFLSVFDLLDAGSVLFYDNEKQKELCEGIDKILNKYGIEGVEYSSLEDKVSTDERWIKEGLNYDLFCMVSILVFCSIGVITTMVSSIKKRMSEFGVHILCGASIVDIMKRIALQIFITMMTAFCIITPIVILKYKTFQYVLVSFLFCTLIAIVFSVVPLFTLAKTNINDIVKGKE